MSNPIALLLAYKYLIFLPLAIVEGPIITVIAGFLASMGLINAFIIYVLAILGDLIGDTILYSIGRWGEKGLYRHGFRIGITPERMKAAKDYFSKHHKRALVTSKVVHGIGISGLVAAGALKISFFRYIRTCFIISLIQSLVFVIIGYLFGNAYQKIGQYLDYFAATVSIIALAVIVIFIFTKLKKSK